MADGIVVEGIICHSWVVESDTNIKTR